MKPRIDDIDRAILDCLHEDARMHSSEIARRLGNYRLIAHQRARSVYYFIWRFGTENPRESG